MATRGQLSTTSDVASSGGCAQGCTTAPLRFVTATRHPESVAVTVRARREMRVFAISAPIGRSPSRPAVSRCPTSIRAAAVTRHPVPSPS